VDGVEQSLDRTGLPIFRHVEADVPQLFEPAVFHQFVIYRCIVGSTGYGLAQEGSDIDRRGFYLPPADVHWSLDEIP
jgi:hypothetical protein